MPEACRLCLEWMNVCLIYLYKHAALGSGLSYTSINNTYRRKSSKLSQYTVKLGNPSQVPLIRACLCSQLLAKLPTLAICIHRRDIVWNMHQTALRDLVGEKYRGRNERPCIILYVHYFSIHVHIHARISTLNLINVAPVYGDFAVRLWASAKCWSLWTYL